MDIKKSIAGMILWSVSLFLQLIKVNNADEIAELLKKAMVLLSKEDEVKKAIKKPAKKPQHKEAAPKEVSH